jgi:hypothetical protein
MLWLKPRLTIASSQAYEKPGMWLAAVPSDNNGYAVDMWKTRYAY